ncbi:MBL fold metallo-hydrolase [soil metagenome]
MTSQTSLTLPARFARRGLCVALLFLLGVSGVAPRAEPGENRLILLGTAGGPGLKKLRAQPANALIVNGAVYIVDAGNGVARQIALADISKALRAVFLTHLHSDHCADYGTLLLRAWTSGLKKPVDTYGPPPLEKMTQSYLDYMSWDIELRIKDENRPPLSSLIRAHNIKGAGVIYEDENVKVTAAEVPHGAAKPSYAYRFDTARRSIVFSGDTARSEELIKLAQGADVLVHEVLNLEAVDALVQAVDPGNASLKRHIVEAHTAIEQVGEVAAAAKVKKLVLTHFVPTGLPAFDRPELWTADVRKHYAGEVIVGEDLLEVK